MQGVLATPISTAAAEMRPVVPLAPKPVVEGPVDDFGIVAIQWYPWNMYP